MDAICSRPINVAGRTIRNDGDCCNPVFTVYEGRPLCRFHYLRMKAHEDCPICLTPMHDGGRRVMLSCCHFYHYDCLGQCREPLCPICRQQMTPQDAAAVFTTPIFRPIIEEIYTLPPSRIDMVVETIRTAISIARRGDWQVSHANDLLHYMGQASNVAESMIESRGMHTPPNSPEDDIDRFAIINSIMSNMVELMYDSMTMSGE